MKTSSGNNFWLYVKDALRLCWVTLCLLGFLFIGVVIALKPLDLVASTMEIMSFKVFFNLCYNSVDMARKCTRDISALSTSKCIFKPSLLQVAEMARDTILLHWLVMNTNVKKSPGTKLSLNPQQRYTAHKKSCSIVDIYIVSSVSVEKSSEAAIKDVNVFQKFLPRYSRVTDKIFV